MRLTSTSHDPLATPITATDQREAKRIVRLIEIADAWEVLGGIGAERVGTAVLVDLLDGAQVDVIAQLGRLQASRASDGAAHDGDRRGPR